MPIFEANKKFVDQITLTLASTGYPGPATATSDEGFLVAAHPDNTATVWVYENATGEDKDKGFPLASITPIYLGVTRLSQVKFESAAAGQKVCWLKC
jgi:hypothetical protein